MSYTADETIKTQMVKGAENINRTIMYKEWEFFWKLLRQHIV